MPPTPTACGFRHGPGQWRWKDTLWLPVTVPVLFFAVILAGVISATEAFVEALRRTDALLRAWWATWVSGDA